MDNIEKVAGAIRVWRIWSIDGFFTPKPRLEGFVSTFTWQAGVNKDEYFLDYFTRGYHGFNSLARIEEQEFNTFSAVRKGGNVTVYGYHGPKYYAIGSILCYGRVRVGEFGVRAECAVPEYIVLSSSEEYNTHLRKLASLYRMKTISEDEAWELKTGIVPYTQVVGTTDVENSQDGYKYPDLEAEKRKKTWPRAFVSFFKDLR